MRNISFGSTYRRFSFFGYLAILFSLFVALTVIGTAFASVTPKISGGASHTIALKSDGTVWAWGANTWGQLGDGTKNYSNYRVQVVGLTDVIAIAAGSYHTVALKSDGTVWTWGSNLYGQLGDGTNTNRNTPVQVSGLNNIVAIAAGRDFTTVLRSDGTVLVWGSIGILDVSIPTQVSGFNGVVAIAAGGEHIITLKSDGTVWGWGSNGFGQLGNGSSGHTDVVVQARELSDVAAIAAGEYHTAALKSGGTIWTWGSNYYGQLGDGTTVDKSTIPVQVVGISDVIAIAAGSYHTVALKSVGTVWAWGQNTKGQLGSGTTGNSNTPLQVSGELSNVTAVAAAANHTMALKSDGTAWTWGSNAFGQLGDGTNESKSAPVQVKDLNLIVSVTPTPLPTATPTATTTVTPTPTLIPTPTPIPTLTPTPIPTPTQGVKGKISGFVADTGGNPIESAKVKAKGVETKIIKKAFSDAEGFFEFAGLEADTYKITGSKKRYKNAKETVTLEEGEGKEIAIEMKRKRK